MTAVELPVKLRAFLANKERNSVQRFKVYIAG